MILRVRINDDFMNTLSLLIFIVLLIAFLEAPLFTVIGACSMLCLYFAAHDLTSLQMVVIEMNRLAVHAGSSGAPPVHLCGVFAYREQCPQTDHEFHAGSVGLASRRSGHGGSVLLRVFLQP